jgi:archaellum component FlaG (FlaF/FlaG flagellin family)
MGYAAAIAWMGVLVITVSACYSLMEMQTAYVKDVSDYYSYEKEIADRQRAEINLTGANYSGNLLEISAKNIGSSVLRFTNAHGAKCTDIIIDGAWISHDNITQELYDKTINPLLWDPMENAKILVNRALDAGNHTISVIECSGAQDDAAFSI